MLNMFPMISITSLAFALLALGMALSPDPLASGQLAPATPAAPTAPNDDLYAVKMKTLDDKDFDFGTQRGKVLLVVNVASKCGYTPQYAQLEKLHQKYKDRGLVVIGVPSNDFGDQEPGSSQEIRDFCTKNYAVTFPLLEKVRTKDGEGQSELYRVLEARTKQLPTWNFCKYLVTRDGKQITFMPSKAAPDSAEMVKTIEEALGVSGSSGSSAPTKPSAPSAPPKE